MRVRFSDEQEFLREAVAGVVERHAPLSRVREWTDAEAPAAADVIAVEQGWSGIGIEEELGGQGGGAIELAILAEQLGRGAVPWDRTLGGCLTASLLGASGDAGARELAAATAAGERVAVLAHDWRLPLRAATIDADGTLDLELDFVGGAAQAAELVLPIADGDAVRLFAIPTDAPGVAVAGRRLVDRTRDLARIDLHGAAARPLGAVDSAVLDATAATAAVLVAADALGTAGLLLEMTVAYVGERLQFGVPVGSFQAVKHAAAEMLVDVEASRSAVHYGAWAVAADEEAPLQASIAKSHAGAAAVRVADKALFLHGAIGYTWEHDLQLLFKRAKSDALLFGSPEAHRDLIASLLGLTPIGAATAAPA